MLVEELITKLQAFDPKMNVCLFDWKVNVGDDTGDGSSEGICQDFQISVMKKGEDDTIAVGGQAGPAVTWLALEIDNPTLNDFGQRILPWNDRHLLELAGDVYSEPDLKDAWVKGYKAAFAAEEEE